MEIDTISSLFANLGVPCACMIVLGLFCWEMIKYIQKTTAEREERLNEQIAKGQDALAAQTKKSQEISEQFARVIEKYSSRLDNIEDNVEEIKTDIIEVKAKIK